MKLLKFFPLLKVDEVTHRVMGMSTAEAPDSEGEICDYQAAVKAYKAWSDAASSSTSASGQDVSYGNIRLQHGTVVAGKVAAPPKFDDLKKQIWLDTEPREEVFRDLKRGMYRGFSQGGDYAWRKCEECGTAMAKGRHCSKCNKTVLVRYGPTISEVSYVDNPCLKAATFSLVKADGVTEEQAFVSPADAFLLKLNDSLATAREQAEELVKYMAAEPVSAVNKQERSEGMESTAVVTELVKETPPSVDVAAITKSVTDGVLEGLKKQEEAKTLAAAVTTVAETVQKAEKETAELVEDDEAFWKVELNELMTKAAEVLGVTKADLLKDIEDRKTLEVKPEVKKAAAADEGVTMNDETEDVLQKGDDEALAKARKSVAEHMSNMNKMLGDHGMAMAAGIQSHSKNMRECMGKLGKLLGAEDMQTFGDNDPKPIDLCAEGTDGDPENMKRKSAEPTFTKAEVEALVAREVNSVVQQMVKAMSSDDEDGDECDDEEEDYKKTKSKSKKAAATAGIGKRDDTPVMLRGMGPAVKVMPETTRVTKAQDTQQTRVTDNEPITQADIHKAAQGDQEAVLKLMKGVRASQEIPNTVAAALGSVR